MVLISFPNCRENGSKTTTIANLILFQFVLKSSLWIIWPLASVHFLPPECLLVLSALLKAGIISSTLNFRHLRLGFVLTIKNPLRTIASYLGVPRRDYGPWLKTPVPCYSTPCEERDANSSSSYLSLVCKRWIDFQAPDFNTVPPGCCRCLRT